MLTRGLGTGWTAKKAKRKRKSRATRLRAARSTRAKGRRPRLPPLERKAAETRVREMHIRNYLRHQPHAALRREVSKERRQQLADAFAALDADNSGSINMAELEVAAKALGFGPKKRARLVADAQRARAVRARRHDDG